MKRLLPLTLILWSVWSAPALGTVGYRLNNTGSATSANPQAFQPVEQPDEEKYQATTLEGTKIEAGRLAVARYKL